MEKRERLTTKFAAAADAAKRPRKTVSEGMTRNLEGFEYDSSKAKVFKKSLHSMNVALGAMISAMKDLSLLRGSEITPDGMLGGRGFIMNFRELKSNLNAAITDLADITDTVADELTNPKWGIDKAEAAEVKQEQEELKDNIEEIEETVQKPAEPEKDSQTPASPGPSASPTEELQSPPMSGEPVEDISPSDVRDAAEVESIKRYENILEGRVGDKTASILSKSILANLLIGEK